MTALDGVGLQVEREEMLAVVGPSGSGKSTLLRILGCLDAMDEGEYRLLGESIPWQSPTDLARVRQRRIAFVLQSSLLVPHLTVIENIELPLRYAKASAARRDATEAAESLGLASLGGRLPHELSGGERQRVAIARAFVGNADLVLADEPTGNLDLGNTGLVIELLGRSASNGAAVVIVTHDPVVVAACHRRLVLRAGRIVASSGHAVVESVDVAAC